MWTIFPLLVGILFYLTTIHYLEISTKVSITHFLVVWDSRHFDAELLPWPGPVGLYCAALYCTVCNGALLPRLAGWVWAKVGREIVTQQQGQVRDRRWEGWWDTQREVVRGHSLWAVCTHTTNDQSALISALAPSYIFSPLCVFVQVSVSQYHTFVTEEMQTSILSAMEKALELLFSRF